MLTQSDNDTELVSMRQAGEMLGGTRGRAHWWRATGRLPSVEMSGRYFTTRESVERLRREKTMPELDKENPSRS